MEEDDQERRKKLEAGKARLAQFRQRKGQSDSQTAAKKNKKKKTSSSSKHQEKHEGPAAEVLSQNEEVLSQTTASGAGSTAEFTIMRTMPHGEIITHDKTYAIEEEEFGVRETFAESNTQESQARLEVMEDELAGKQQEIEELNRELEEMRAAYGTEGLQQLQEFETAIKQRDGIITQLTSNLQQARKEKDDIMREFLELTEQSQKLKIQFQHLQASETLRTTSHTSTAADLLHSKQQILVYQQLLEDRDNQLSLSQRENGDFRTQVLSLQDQIQNLQQVQLKELELSYEQKLNERNNIVDGLKSSLRDEELKSRELRERTCTAEKSVDELRELLTQKSQELNSLSEELNSSRQKERRSSDEIKQLMGTVEDLQKKNHKESQSEADLIQRKELETQRKLEQLQAELEEMHGQQIVQMKQELVRQQTSEIERLIAQHKLEVDAVSSQTAISITNIQITELNAVIDELKAKVSQSDEQRIKMNEDFSQELQAVSSEKSHLQKQIEDLLQDLSFAREQIHRAKQNLSEKDNKLSEASALFTTIDNLKAELAAAIEFTKDLQSKHEAEVTNYKIKLEMLEREKDAVLDRMAESQEAELEKVRTHFLFSQEEELSKLRDDLTQEHRTNIENLKDNLEVRYKQQIDQMQHEISQTVGALQSEKDSLITKQNLLMLEISKLRGSLQSGADPKSEEMLVQTNELQTMLDGLRREEKGSVEQELQVLHLRIELLENEVKDKDALKEKLVSLEGDKKLLMDENETLQNIVKQQNIENCAEQTEQVSSDDFDLKNKIELLSSENMQLRNLELQLKEEIERQKNTFSFAERNFEVNYQELREEYACLVKIKERLEEDKLKLSEDYTIQVSALNDELLKLKSGAAPETQLGVFEPSELVNTDRFDAGEVVEKDTTELMEKLDMAQRDNQELTVKLSSLSEELQLKQNEINQLKEQVRSMEHDHTNIEKEVLKERSLECKSSHATVGSPTKDEGLVEEETVLPATSAHPSPGTCDLQAQIQDLLKERDSLLQKLNLLTSKLEEESSVLGCTPLEKDKIQNNLGSVLQDQTDVILQLEAQRISLTQIHKAHLELITESFQTERERDLCTMREELLRDQEQKIQELQHLHRQELDCSQRLSAGDNAQTCQILTELLMKKITDETDHIIQVLQESATEDVPSKHEQTGASDLTHDTSLEQYRTAMQTVHSNLTALMERFLKEYNLMSDLSTHFVQAGDLHSKTEQPDIGGVKQIVINSQLTQADVQEVQIAAAPSQEVDTLKMEFGLQRAQLEEKHSQEIEHLRSYFQQQMKENEDRFSTEMIHLQELLENVTTGSLESRELHDIEPGLNLGSQEAYIFHSVYVPVTDQMDDSANPSDYSLRRSYGPIYQQLQSLRQALYSKYVEEVNGLKKQHEAELDQLRAELAGRLNSENAAAKQEILPRPDSRPGLLSGRFQEPTLCTIVEEESPANLNQLLEERYHERIEEEIARVIVEMTITFAQQKERERLASLQSGQVADQKECSEEQEKTFDANVEDPVREEFLDEQRPEFESLELKQQIENQLSDSQVANKPDVDLATVEASRISSTREEGADLTREDSPANFEIETVSKEKTVVLKEEDYKLMVAMGAESAKFKQMYEERVEEMRQELVRQEQEYQQATEALRLAHTAQLERQMSNQEQLMSDLDSLQAQLAENASMISENQVTDREKMLLDELEALKKSWAEVRAAQQQSSLQDNSSQTQDEADRQPESRDPAWESGQADEEKRVEDSEALSNDPSNERKTLKRANKHLLDLLLEVVKTTSAVEETIGRHVLGLLDKPGRRQSTSKVIVWNPEPEGLAVVSPADNALTDPRDVATCAGAKIAGIWSEASEDELGLPLQLTDGVFSGAGLSPEDEVQVLNISSRLQAAVEKLLQAINETSNQLDHAKAAQTELVRESFKRKQETTDLQRCQEELQERLNEEAKTREHLALELSKAEGLLDGYTDERVFLEKQMKEKCDLIRHLEQELQSTGNRLQELEQERQQIEEEKELLSRQKLALKADAAPAEQKLLEETEKLLNEKIEVQRQAEKDSGDLHKHVKVLEVELEEQVNRYLELEQEKNADLEDLRQKNLSVEKQLEKTRRFLDEQAVDREHERDVFQQEIQKLEQQLKIPQRHQPVSDHQNNEVEKLENNLKEKTDKCSELLLCKEQLQRDVQERNEEIEKLEGRIRELEQALIISADNLQQVEDRRSSIVIGVRGEMPLEAQLQVEREAIDRKEKEITNLEEQLEQFREELENKNEEVQQLHMQLEIQRKESATRLQELDQEIKVLKDEIGTTHEENQQTFSSKQPPLRSGTLEGLLLSKDQEIDHLNEQIGRLQAQFESATDNKVIEEKNEQIKEYKSQIKCLKSDQERLKKNSEEEIEKLNEVIEKLQEELSRIERKVTVDFSGVTDATHRFVDIADKGDISQLPVTDSVVTLTNMEELKSSAKQKVTNNLASENRPQPSSQVSEAFQSDKQDAVQEMHSRLLQLQQVINEKDNELKQYYDHVVDLKMQTQEIRALNETIEKLQLELVDRDQKTVWSLETQETKCLNHQNKPEKVAHHPTIELNNVDGTLLNSELEATKAELKLVREELENIRNSSENTVVNEVAAIKLEENVRTEYRVSVEKLMESLREKTAQHLAAEALLLSVQETSTHKIHQLETQLHDLQKTAKGNELELPWVFNAAESISVDSDIKAKYGEPQTSQGAASYEYIDLLQDSKAESKETKVELRLLKEEIKKLRESRASENGKAGLEVTNLEQALREKTAQFLESQGRLSSVQETAKATLLNMESQLQELQKVVEIKDSELLQYLDQNDVLQQQSMEIEQLNEVVRNLQLELVNMEQETVDYGVHEKGKVSQKSWSGALIDQKGDEGTLVTAELEETKTELALLKEELKGLRKPQASIDFEKETSTEERHISKDLQQTFSDQTTKPLVNQTLFTPTKETVQTTILNMESQLQELQKVIEIKDSELLQYMDQSDLLHQQSMEIERLNEMVRKLQLDLLNVEQETVDYGVHGKDKDSQKIYSSGLQDQKELLLQRAELDGDEGTLVKAELEEARTALSLLKEELKRLKDSQPNIHMEATSAQERHVKNDMEPTAQPIVNPTFTSTKETTHNTESQLQELQKVVLLKDAELLQYVNQHDTLNQQAKEIERLNDIIQSFYQKLEQTEQKTSIAEVGVNIHQLTSKELETEPAQEINGGWDTGPIQAGTEVKKSHEEAVLLQRIHEDEDTSRSESSTDVALSTSVYDNSIDSLESQLQELQKVLKDKDLEILLYLEEIETLKEQVKVESDLRDQVILTMEDTLREKVAAALVSEAQLKAIQVHTRLAHEDDKSDVQEDESKILEELYFSSSEKEVEAEAKLSELSLRLLELEKQLSDVHEQVQMERNQVSIANQKAAEKERELLEMQRAMERGSEKPNWNQTENQEIRDVAVLQRSVEVSGDNTVTTLEHTLQMLTAEATATKEELGHYREMAEKLREQVKVKESSLAHVEEDLREVKRCLANAEEKLAFYMKKELQQEEEQNLSGVEYPDGLRSPGWTSLGRTSSSSQTDNVSSVNHSNQTSRVHHKHIGVQNELETGQPANTSDEVVELMEQYTEKIGQMQELHAAEILDMEARHISEAEALRREQYTVVQALTEECNALKAVIEALKPAGGAVPDSALSASYHFTDATSSECDWSQGTYDVQSFDQLPEGLRDEEAQTELISSKIKDLLRAVHQEGMQVLSLTQVTSPEKETPVTVKTQPWYEEQKALLGTIASLKDLIGKMQIHKASEGHNRSDFHDRSPDWRGELLRAVQEVFCREQDVLMSAFHTQLASLGSHDVTSLVQQMQNRLQEQGMEQMTAMDCIQNADRRSLLLEIQDLRAQLMGFQNLPGTSPLFCSDTEAGAAQSMQQEKPLHSQQEVRLQLDSMNANASQLEEQLGTERLLTAEIKNELALTKMELETTLKLQHKHFKELESVRTELKNRREELDNLNDALANEQKKTRELQWTLEKEKTKSERNELREKEELEDLQILLEGQKSKNAEISKLLEEEKELVKHLQEEMASRESQYDTELSLEKSRVSELQTFLEVEKTRSSKLANALECNQGLEAGSEDRSKELKPTEDLLSELQSQLDSKHDRVVELVGEVESSKLECIQLRQNLEEERQRLRKELEAEREVATLARKQVEELMSSVEYLQRQIQERLTEIKRHQTEEKHLKDTIHRLQSNAQDGVEESGCQRKELLECSTTGVSAAEPAKSGAQLQTGSIPNILCPDPLSTLNGDHDTEEAGFSMENIRRRLQKVSSKLRPLAAKASQRILFESADDRDFAWSQNSLQDVISQLQHVAVLSLQGQNVVLPPGMPANTLTEKLLTQNAELTGYVSRLTEEKNDLQNTVLRLEGEVSRHRSAGPSGDYCYRSAADSTVNMDELLAERDTWNREKLNLHKSLKQTEAELSKVKTELRNEAMQRDLGRDTENMALRRIYGKYLRSESFRKALVYQKKYLLLLLGGFQECEEATLALIARMGGQPTYTDLEVITNHSRAFTRFRSAARVTIAITRMKFLVRRWQRATNPGTGGVNRNGFGQNSGDEVRTDSPYHPAGGDQRLLSCRPRSGFNSPQSTVNSQHRYISNSDLSPCSHLQHYDPDRALTDYIARLEALQKRLGSVPSGSSANNTTHHSVRR